MAFRSRSDGSHYPVRRGLYGRPARSRLYEEEINFSNMNQASESVTFANKRWEDLAGRRKERVHLLQAMNQASNRAAVEARNQNVSAERRGKAYDASIVLRAWVEAHKGKE